MNDCHHGFVEAADTRCLLPPPAQARDARTGLFLLGGSWAVISLACKQDNYNIVVACIWRLLPPFITTHEPPSIPSYVYFRLTDTQAWKHAEPMLQTQQNPLII